MKLISTLAAVFGLALLPAHTSAQAPKATVAPAESYPARPVRLVVPFPPGGSTDIVARLIALKLSEKFGQQFVVDNRAGANGVVGTQLVARAPNDGYTLLLGTTSTLAVNPHLYRDIGYDPVRDFAPVSSLVVFTNVLVVNPSVPARSLGELIALAKAKPGALNFGSAGSGNTTHLAGELFKRMAGVDIVHVPYKGGAPALTALIAGEVQILFNNTPETLPFIRDGRVRALAVTTRERIPMLPQVPTISEAGVPGYEMTGWGGIVAPAGTPKEIVGSLDAAINEILRAADVGDRLKSMNLIPTGGTADAFGVFIRDEGEKWGRVVHESGAKVD